MVKKPKFKPVITRVKLNPEQAVLTCTCMSRNTRWTGGDHTMWGPTQGPDICHRPDRGPMFNTATCTHSSGGGNSVWPREASSSSS